MAIYTRLGCLFLDFKGRPAACALFFVVKLCKNLVKGALVGVFYGESCSPAPGASIDLAYPVNHCRVCITLCKVHPWK